MPQARHRRARPPGSSIATRTCYTFMDFERDFPDDIACMAWLVGFLYPDGIFCPKCQKVTKHHPVKARTCYACQFCGHQEYPVRGTIFEDSATSLRLWFHGIFLMSSTRCRISANQLERELRVTYTTAWRMFNKIRSLLTEDADPFSGEVEVDETYIGGHVARAHGGARQARGQRTKDVVFGAAQCGQDGTKTKVKAAVVPHSDAASLIPQVRAKVLPASMIYTDDLRSYRGLSRLGYEHRG